MPSKNEKTRRAETLASERDGLENGNQAPFEAVTYPKYTPEQLDRARRKALDAERKIAASPEAWEAVTRAFLSAAREGRHITADTIAATFRMSWASHMREDGGADVTHNNDHDPYFVRRIIRDHPEVRAVVELRGSVFDALFKSGEEESDA